MAAAVESKRQIDRSEFRRQWAMLTTYGRFEQFVAFVLGLVIGVVILVALLQLILRLTPLMLGGVLDPLEHGAFQSLFGGMMTLLIAMEFRHSIIRVSQRREGVIQVKTVLLIAILALSRKFVVLDHHATDAATIAALAGTTLVLGVVYWLLRERDDRLSGKVDSRQGDDPGRVAD